MKAQRGNARRRALLAKVRGRTVVIPPYQGSRLSHVVIDEAAAIDLGVEI